MPTRAQQGDDLDDTEHTLAQCPRFHAAIELLGRRWNGVILQRLLEEPLRFSEIRRDIPRLTDSMLAQRLRELEDAGIVERTVVAQRPVQVLYGLTSVGSRLAPVFAAVAEWSHEWAGGPDRPEPTTRPAN